MSQIEAMKPLSRYDRQRILNQSVRANTDFDCSDDEFFAGTGRLTRIRPPRPGEHSGDVQSVRMAALTPMIVVKRSSTMVGPLAFALMGLTEAEHEKLMAELPRMGEADMLGMLNGAPKAMMQGVPRWWPLVPPPAPELKPAKSDDATGATKATEAGAIAENEETSDA